MNSAVDVVTAHEPAIRLAVFAGAFLLLAMLEYAVPRRHDLGRKSRWPANLGVVVLDTLVVRALFPVSAVAFAALAQARGWGALNAGAAPAWLAVPLAVVVLDLAIYAQHVIFHAVPWLWRLHRMHHADTGFDVTTGIRFHPIEIVLSFVIKLAVVAALGAPPLAVLVFEILLNATAMFSHANLCLPAGADRLLRRVVVTPDMHRVHHSRVMRETNSNFGFNLSVWDRLFGTYRAEPAAGHDGVAIGVDGLGDASEQRFDRLLTQPFRTPRPGA